MKKAVAMFAALSMALTMMTTGAFAAGTDLSIAVDSDIETLHASNYSTTVEVNILNQIYDPLIYMDPAGDKEPEARLAESWEISEDGKDYTFHLRDGVKFHDGSDFTAADVVFSLEMYMNSEYQGANVEGLESVEALDDKTVVCHLSHPYSPFMLGLASCHIASKTYHDSVSEDDFANAPVGTGAYKYVSRAIGSNIVLEANEDYFRGAPAIKNVTFNVIGEVASTAMALQAGDVSFAEIDSSIMPQLQANPAITIAEAPTSGFAFVSMNTEKEPFNDVRVRQAVNYAIDRQNIINVCYEGEAVENSNICATDRFGYKEEQPQYSYDPEKAAALLEEAGIETPYDLGSILVAQKYANLATVVQADLAKVGLNCTIETKEFNAYIGELTSGNYSVAALEMTLEGETQQLELAFKTDYIGMANNARYSDADMDALWESAAAEEDQEKRAEIFDEIFTKAQDEAIYAVICNPETLYAYDANLTVPEFSLEGYYYVYDFAWNN